MKLDTPKGRKLIHSECSEYLEREVFQLLTSIHSAVPSSEDNLLKEITEVFSEEDNGILVALPTEKELKSIIDSFNLNATLGSDGIPGLVYTVCWDILKDLLLKVMVVVHSDKHPTVSQKTGIMVFSNKPKKHNPSYLVIKDVSAFLIQT